MPGARGKRVQIPIAGLMVVIAMLALEMGSFRVASDGYVDLTRHLTVVMLATAAYLARYREGVRAAWWFGFALFGCAYFALALDASARRDIASPRSLGALPPVTLLGLLVSEESLTSNNPALVKHWWNQYEILQSILTLVVASLGGLAGWMLARRRGAPFREEERRAGKLELDDRVK
jgi:hypothetical protein